MYCQKPFAGSEGIIQYLGNYTHRVAISNHRIEAFKNTKVTFSYKDYRTGGMKKSIALETKEFVRRFMQHILSNFAGFIKSNILACSLCVTWLQNWKPASALLKRKATFQYWKDLMQWRYGGLFLVKIPENAQNAIKVK